MNGPRWLRVVGGALVFFLLTPIFWGLFSFESYGANALAQGLSMLAAVFVASKIAHGDVFIAVLPALLFYVLVLVILFDDALDPGGLTLRTWGAMAVFIALSSFLALWLARRERRKEELDPEVA